MRKGLLAIICLSLAGCLSNPNGHPSARPFTPTELSFSHHYVVPPAYVFYSPDWWSRFHDKQLDQLMVVALADSPDIHIARARLEQADQAAQGATSPLWPQIDTSGYLRRERFAKFGLVPPPFNGKIFNIGEVGFNLNYELDFWGKNRNLLAARVNEACAAAADAALARLMITSAVATVYFELQGNLARVEVAERTLSRRQHLLDIINERAKNGIESQIPVSTQLSQLEQAQQSLEQSKNNVSLARHQLAVLLGKNPQNTDFDVLPLSLNTRYPSIPPCLPAHLLVARPDVRSAQFLAESAAHSINIAKARFFPDINISALFSYQSVRLGKLFAPESQDNAIQGAFDLPIFDAGLRRADLGVQYARYDEAVNTYDRTLLNALHDVIDEKDTLHSLSAQRIAQAKSLHAIQRSYRLTELRYRHGVADYVEVLQAEQILLQQEDLQLVLQTQQLEHIVGLIKALGGNVDS